MTEISSLIENVSDNINRKTIENHHRYNPRIAVNIPNNACFVGCMKIYEIALRYMWTPSCDSDHVKGFKTTHSKPNDN